MRPTQVLFAEHRLIERALDGLERVVLRADAEGRLDVPAAETLLDFLRRFADLVHHGKEEEVLFPVLERRGLSPDVGPTAVMRAEHVLGRDLVRELGAALEGIRLGSRAAFDRFHRDAARYVDLLRAHIQKEDHCLFAMADSVLSAGDEREVIAAFARADEAALLPHEREELLAGLEAVLARLGIAAAESAGASASCP